MKAAGTSGKRGLARIPALLREFVPVRGFSLLRRSGAPVAAAAVAIAAIALLLVPVSPAAEETADVEMLYQEALHKEEGEGDLEGALKAYGRVLAEYDKTAPLAAKAGLRVGKILERMGNKKDALAAYREVAAKFAGSAEAAEAVARLEALGAFPVPGGAEDASDLAKRQIERHLKRRLPTFDFPNASFDVLVNVLRELSEVSIVVDARITPPKENLSLKLRDVDLQDILSYITRMTELDWTIWKGAIFISDPRYIADIRREETVTDLDAAEIALLDARIDAAHAFLERAKQGLEAGRSSEKELIDAQLALMEAQLAKKRFLAQSVPSGTEEPAPFRGAGGAAAPAESAPIALQSAPEIKALMPNAKVVLLYNIFLSNFSGPQFLDLDTGRTVSSGGLRHLYYAEPAFDLAFAVRKSSTQEGVVTENVSFITGNTSRAVYVPADTTAGSTPSGLDYGGSSAGSIDLRDLPFVVQTASAEYLIRARREGDSTVRLYYEKVSDRGSGLEDPRVPEADKAVAEARREWESAVAQFTRGEGSRDRAIGRAAELIEAKLDRVKALIQRAGGPEEKKALERDAATLQKAYDDATDLRERMRTEGKVSGSATLFRAGLPAFAGPQVLDIDKGVTKALPEGTDAKAFFKEHGEFDLAYYGPESALGNKGLKAAVITQRSSRSLDMLPEEIEYPEPPKAPDAFEYDERGRLEGNQGGIYRDKDGYVILVQFPCIVRTDGGEYLIHGIGRGEECIQFGYQKLPPREPLPEIPVLESD